MLSISFLNKLKDKNQMQITFQIGIESTPWTVTIELQPSIRPIEIRKLIPEKYNTEKSCTFNSSDENLTNIEITEKHILLLRVK